MLIVGGFQEAEPAKLKLAALAVATKRLSSFHSKLTTNAVFLNPDKIDQKNRLTLPRNLRFSRQLATVKNMWNTTPYILLNNYVSVEHVITSFETNSS